MCCKFMGYSEYCWSQKELGATKVVESINDHTLAASFMLSTSKQLNYITYVLYSSFTQVIW